MNQCKRLLIVYQIVAHSMSYANACFNPIVYCFLGEGFRKAAFRARNKLCGASGQRPVGTGTTADDVAVILGGQSIEIQENTAQSVGLQMHQ